ncbi:hypothetical protein GBAR_LOCUS13769 [Geodia barretti]|uniref:Uncharacterized protein n=1 Tax=Geodia barretti TaxID=519541 RepID=A0AA35S538_GEOBA|nr:hypothetical protein GBAR_LOCUS13769 [Geodia barretti]
MRATVTGSENIPPPTPVTACTWSIQVSFNSSYILATSSPEWGDDDMMTL